MKVHSLTQHTTVPDIHRNKPVHVLQLLDQAVAAEFNKRAKHTRPELCVHRWPQCSLCHRLLLPPQPPSLYATLSFLFLQSVVFQKQCALVSVMCRCGLYNIAPQLQIALQCGSTSSSQTGAHAGSIATKASDTPSMYNAASSAQLSARENIKMNDGTQCVNGLLDGTDRLNSSDLSLYLVKLGGSAANDQSAHICKQKLEQICLQC